MDLLLRKRQKYDSRSYRNNFFCFIPESVSWRISNELILRLNLIRLIQLFNGILNTKCITMRSDYMKCEEKYSKKFMERCISIYYPHIWLGLYVRKKETPGVNFSQQLPVLTYNCFFPSHFICKQNWIYYSLRNHP